MELLNANSYQKGGWVLHMLRRQLGDSVFHESIRTYYATYAGKNADTRDLQKIFEKVSGKNLSTFFQQWLYTPGIPKLDISWKYLTKEKKLSHYCKTITKNYLSISIGIAIETMLQETFKTPSQYFKTGTKHFYIPAKEKIC